MCELRRQMRKELWVLSVGRVGTLLFMNCSLNEVERIRIDVNCCQRRCLDWTCHVTLVFEDGSRAVVFSGTSFFFCPVSVCFFRTPSSSVCVRVQNEHASLAQAGQDHLFKTEIQTGKDVIARPSPVHDFTRMVHH